MIAKGDSVTYTRSFLQRLGAYAADFDDRGLVLELRHQGRFALVEWDRGAVQLAACANLCKCVREEGRELDMGSGVRPFGGRLLVLDPSE